MNKGLMFPDQLFEINDEELYKKTVSAGYQIAKGKKILFCGICRNVGDRLERNILRMQYTAQYFKDHHIFIYENDSTDDTVDILKRYRSEKLDYISDTRSDKNYDTMLQAGEDPVHYNRCKVLADCRNMYLSEIEYHDADFVCVLDLDLWGGWSYNGFLHALAVLENRPTNGAVTAYGVLADCINKNPLEAVHPSKYLMYDCFVFRPHGEDKAQPKHETGRYNFINQKPGDNVAFVNSNFNGLGLYKKEAFKDVNYGVKLWDARSVDADHVVLHRQMKEKGWDILFNPSMVVSYADHQYSQIPLEKTNNEQEKGSNVPRKCKERHQSC